MRFYTLLCTLLCTLWSRHMRPSMQSKPYRVVEVAQGGAVSVQTCVLERLLARHPVR